jgi:hypothetical protein
MQVARHDGSVFVLDRDALLRLWLIEALESDRIDAAEAAHLWTRQRDNSAFLTAYFSVPSVGTLLIALYDDLEPILGRAWLKTFNGAPHIVAKGSSRMRRLLVEPRFDGQPVKVVALAMNAAGVAPVRRRGGATVSLILLTREDVAPAVLRDEATLMQAGLPAPAIMRAAAAGGLGAAAGTLSSGAMAGTFAIDSLIVAATVSAGANAALAWLDSRSTQVARLNRMLSDGSARLEAGEADAGRRLVSGTIVRRPPGRLVDLAPEPAPAGGSTRLGRLRWRFLPNG